jgi:ribosomal protein L37AE/L43A
MKAKKTIKAKIVKLTKTKADFLNREFDNLQLYLLGNKGVELYSANKQQADRFYKKIKPGKQYPLSIRKSKLIRKKKKGDFFLHISIEKEILVSEKNTSKTCSKCGSNDGKRLYQGLFKCNNRGYQVNADFNGAKNILKRSMKYISKDRASVDMLMEPERLFATSEATQLVGW